MASISTPTQLATFPQPHASSSKLPPVTLGPVNGDSGSAVAAVQGDGIWTYDLNTLRPTTSFTVPPSTVFSTIPISYWKTTTRTVSKEKPNADTTEIQEVMDVDEDEDLDDEEGEEEDDELIEEKERITLIGVGKEVWIWKGDEGDKEIISIGKSVQAIHHLTANAWSNLIITSNPTALHFLDESLQIHQVDLSTASIDIITSKLISKTENSARLVMIGSQGEVYIHQLVMDSIPRADKITEGKIGEGSFSYADISDEGVITALDSSNNLHTREISSLSTSSSPLRLGHPSPTAALLSLPSSGKPTILLPTSHPSPSLLLTIPLSTLPAILSFTQVSSFTSTGSITHLSILSRKNGILTIGLVLNHVNSDGQGGRNVIYTTELVLPTKGIGMGMLLGTKEKTQTYLATASSTRHSPSASNTTEDDLIKKFQDLLNKKDDISAAKLLDDRLDDNRVIPEEVVRSLVQSIFTSALNNDGKLKGHYASSVIRSMVSGGLVNDSMWKESLVGDGLLPCGDWDNILSCLQNFRTIPTSTLVKLIASSLNPTEANAKNVPNLEDILNLIMKTPPAPTFRLDIRQNLSVEDATSVLEQLVHWAEKHVLLRATVLKGWDDEAISTEEGQEDIPTLGSVITYSNLLLDSHLPLFMNHQPSHSALEALQSNLVPLMEAQDQYRKLQGPVESILILSRREQAKIREIEAKRGKGKGGKKDNALSAGRLPEEKVGKWKVEELVF
ncbi:uncharacterized protein I206_103248 [Kwoniella pini CBS 10737]|uniref:U3 small nucleolar RNA-associated protein 8 n=1 Tax=Kwoniella pini CBS 10737 TaxID=1296096 RepID=A0A1B9IA80_9TREE|nr:uncharacterized protein I206_01746 [Kwoniella pini CBS 10737]OCF52456.1 hypothetical protein I206_01746 [Kwoniella pini CBS 10737]